MIGLFQENGPCGVNNDSSSTYLNPWSWNNEVNMLYIDQPAQVGMSYDVLTNVSVNQPSLDQNSIVTVLTGAVPAGNNTFMTGTYGSQNASGAANSTENVSDDSSDLSEESTDCLTGC